MDRAIAFCVVVLLAFLSSCSSEGVDFQMMTNFDGGDTVCLDMDLKDVVNAGIVLPSERQCEGGRFLFSFRGEKGKYYKVYYQNESYKFENDDEHNDENFYGSWEDVGVGFKRIARGGRVEDSIRIVGNPRDERRYYGKDRRVDNLSDEAVEKVVKAIKSSPEWSASVAQKAIDKQVTFERQLHNDARWLINSELNDGDDNNRWKRNPRVGCYSFMLVVCDEAALAQMPEYIKNIGSTDENGRFVNPYAFFAKNTIPGVEVFMSDRVLKTRAVITPEYGIYFGKEHYSDALFEQFFSDVSHQYTLRNIPVIQDVVSDENPYTRAQYEANKTRFDSTQLLYDYPYVSEAPGKTVKIDEADGGIMLINPGNDDVNNLRKESTGIRTRVGFTYGKIRAKIKFPPMLNDENIWNGLTYAFWLIHQEDHPWNNRRTSPSGYVHKASSDQDPVILSDYCYSEIDIEIAKSSRYWPKAYYFAEADSHVEDASLNNNVTFGCTNWDMACRDPENYSSGVFTMDYGDRNYEAMRWNPNTQAMTIRTMMSNEVFDDDVHYYEIDWQPRSITWRHGNSPDNMVEAGYVDDSYSSIPDNQMQCIVTQEYHYSEWHAPVVFWQGLIPYNKSDIVGKVYEIVIE